MEYKNQKILKCPVCDESGEDGPYYHHSEKEKRLICCTEMGNSFKPTFDEAVEEWNRCVIEYKNKNNITTLREDLDKANNRIKQLEEENKRLRLNQKDLTDAW